jgi:hypothetical protein
MVMDGVVPCAGEKKRQGDNIRRRNREIGNQFDLLTRSTVQPQILPRACPQCLRG